MQIQEKKVTKMMTEKLEVEAKVIKEYTIVGLKQNKIVTKVEYWLKQNVIKTKRQLTR